VLFPRVGRQSLATQYGLPDGGISCTGKSLGRLATGHRAVAEWTRATLSAQIRTVAGFAEVLERKETLVAEARNHPNC
jgi:hypothetical protein